MWCERLLVFQVCELNAVCFLILALTSLAVPPWRSFCNTIWNWLPLPSMIIVVLYLLLTVMTLVLLCWVFCWSVEVAASGSDRCASSVGDGMLKWKITSHCSVSFIVWRLGYWSFCFMVQSMQRRKRKGDRFSPFDAFDGNVNYHLPRKQMQTNKPPSNCHSGWLGRLMLTTTIIQIEIIE